VFLRRYGGQFRWRDADCLGLAIDGYLHLPIAGQLEFSGCLGRTGADGERDKYEGAKAGNVHALSKPADVLELSMVM
jgi:hypothetical protein